MWVDIIGYEGLYQINKNGEVKSLSRTIKNNKGNQLLPESILKHSFSGRGYPSVTLRKNNKSKTHYIHRLIAEHFIPNPNRLPTVNHKDGNKMNNAIENLEWKSYSGNNQHAYDNGLKARGELFYNAKLTEDEVREIILNGKGNRTYQEIADEYGVARATIRDILIKKTWNHLHTQLENSNDYSERK